MTATASRPRRRTRDALRTLRKVVLGETWAVPVGVAVAVGAAALLRLVAGGGWWRTGGGFVLLGLVVGAYALAAGARGGVRLRRRRSARGEIAATHH